MPDVHKRLRRVLIISYISILPVLTLADNSPEHRSLSVVFCRFRESSLLAVRKSSSTVGLYGHCVLRVGRVAEEWHADTRHPFVLTLSGIRALEKRGHETFDETGRRRKFSAGDMITQRFQPAPTVVGSWVTYTTPQVPQALMKWVVTGVADNEVQCKVELLLSGAVKKTSYKTVRRDSVPRTFDRQEEVHFRNRTLKCYVKKEGNTTRGYSSDVPITGIVQVFENGTKILELHDYSSCIQCPRADSGAVRGDRKRA